MYFKRDGSYTSHNRYKEFNSRLVNLNLDTWADILYMSLTFGASNKIDVTKSIEDLSCYFTQQKFDNLAGDEYRTALENEFIDVVVNSVNDETVKKNADQIREDSKCFGKMRGAAIARILTESAVRARRVFY